MKYSKKNNIILDKRKPKTIKEYKDYLYYWATDFTCRYHKGNYFIMLNILDKRQVQETVYHKNELEAFRLAYEAVKK